jgi:hypothetical protein
MAVESPQGSSSFLSRAWREVRLMLVILTDLSFKRFVTPRLVRLIYFISLIAAALSALAWMISGFKTGVIYGLFTIATGPVAFFIYMLTARVVLEFMLAVFRIAENTEKLRERTDHR